MKQPQWKADGYANQAEYLKAVRKSLHSDLMFFLKDKMCPNRAHAIQDRNERIRRIDTMLRTM